MQVTAQKRQVTVHLSEEACARVAKQFDLIPTREKELFNLMQGLARRFERRPFFPDHHQKKEVLQQLSKALSQAAALISKHPKHLEGPIYNGILPTLGDVTSKHGIERLIGHQLKLSRDVSHERIAVALQIGPDLIVSLFDELRQPINEALDLARLNKGGRPRHHYYRDVVIQELGRNYKRFFGKLPTSSPTGHFVQFCRAIFDELKCEQKGFEKSFPVILRAIGVLKESPTRAGRKKRSST